MSGVVIGRGGEAGWCERSEPRCGAARGTCVSHNDLLSLIPLDPLLAPGQVFLSFDPSQSGSLLPVMEAWSTLSFMPQSCQSVLIL